MIKPINALRLPEHCVTNLLELIPILSKPEIQLEMCRYLTSEVYEGCHSVACVIGHAFYNHIGEKEFFANGYPNYSKYSEETFVTWERKYEGVLVWYYLFGESNDNYASTAIARIRLLLSSSIEEIQLIYSNSVYGGTGV
jgi:hypothetical protein